MSLFILGIVIFFGIHFIPSTSIKPLMISRLGEMKFKGIFSLISLVGLGLLIYGFSQTEFQALWAPQSWGRNAAIFTMPFVIILMCAAEMPGNIKRLTRHPMLIGITLWGASHLAANGDLASTILFGCFLAFSIANILIVNRRGTYSPPPSANMAWDFGAIILGLALYVVLFYFHGTFTGMPLI